MVVSDIMLLIIQLVATALEISPVPVNATFFFFGK